MSENDLAESDWPSNYFNYFTEIEDHFQRARGSSLFLLSPLDWALIESWKNSGVPLEAVLKGINDAFEKWHARKAKRRMINSLAYCAQAVAEAAQRAPQANNAEAAQSAPFAVEELRNHLTAASARIRQQQQTAFLDVATALDALAADAEKYAQNLEELEQRLTAMEEKLAAGVRVLQSEEELFAIRQSLEKELKPYRGKMTAAQISMLERRYLDSALFERAKLPRLSLFYLH
jgi:DNA repair exonuclease SbcCD ATPase subunit